MDYNYSSFILKTSLSVQDLDVQRSSDSWFESISFLQAFGSVFARNSDSWFESTSAFHLDVALSSVGPLYAPLAELLTSPDALLAEPLANPGVVFKVLRFRRKRNAMKLAKTIRTRVASPTPKPISVPVFGLCVSSPAACDMVMVAAVMTVTVGTADLETCLAIPVLLAFAVVITVKVGTAAVETCSAMPGLLGSSYSKRSEAFHLISTPSAVIVVPDVVVIQ